MIEEILFLCRSNACFLSATTAFFGRQPRARGPALPCFALLHTETERVLRISAMRFSTELRKASVDLNHVGHEVPATNADNWVSPPPLTSPRLKGLKHPPVPPFLHFSSQTPHQHGCRESSFAW